MDFFELPTKFHWNDKKIFNISFDVYCLLVICLLLTPNKVITLPPTVVPSVNMITNNINTFGYGSRRGWFLQIVKSLALSATRNNISENINKS